MSGSESRDYYWLILKFSNDWLVAYESTMIYTLITTGLKASDSDGLTVATRYVAAARGLT